MEFLNQNILPFLEVLATYCPLSVLNICASLVPEAVLALLRHGCAHESQGLWVNAAFDSVGLGGV